MHVDLLCLLLASFIPAGFSLTNIPQGNEELFWVVAMIGVVILILMALILLVSLIKIYLKSGKVGLLKSVGLSGWLILLLFIPFGQFVLWGLVSLHLARAFGRTWHFGLGLFFLPYIFLPILAWGKAEYISVGAPDVPS